MKYIKQFESNNFKLTIDNNYCWLIYGDVKGILKIYHKIEKPNKNKIKTGLEQSLKNDYYDATGAYLFCEKAPTNFSFWAFCGTQDQNDAKQYIIDKKFQLQGELKLVDNKIILDTLEITRDKFNI